MRSLYDYDAQGPDEISMKEGELIALTEGPSGGVNYGDGWWEGKYIARSIGSLLQPHGKDMTRRGNEAYSLLTM